MVKKVQIMAAIVLVIGLLLASCAPGAQDPKSQVTIAAQKPAAPEDRWGKTLTAAKQEGKVVIYGEIGPAMRTKMPAAFKNRFGIELEVVTASAAEIAQRYLSEDTAGIHLADVIFNGGGTFLRSIKPKGVLAPIEPFLILPEIKDPKSWREGKLPYLDKDRTIVQSTMGRMPMVIVNTDIVKNDEIASYQDLLNPKWRSKIVIFDPTMSGGGSIWVAFLLSKVYGLEEGKKYLQRMPSQEPMITRDKRLAVEWTAKGKYAVHIGPNLQSIAEFKAAGAPIKEVREREGSLVQPSSSCFAITTKPEHPNAATVLVNWLMTAEAGSILSESFGYPSSRADVPVAGLDPLGVPLPGEKVFFNDEELVEFQMTTALDVAKEIFGPLMK